MTFLESLQKGCENILRLPDGPKKQGLIDAAKETLFAYFVEEKITKQTYQQLLALLCKDA